MCISDSISPVLGRIADSSSVVTVLWILTGLAVAACLASYTVPDAPAAVHVEAKAHADS